MTQDTSTSIQTVGLDLGDRQSVYAVQAGEEVTSRGRVATTTPKLEGFLRSLPPSRVVLEVGTHSPWVSRLVRKCGHEALVLNPRRLELISKSLNKTDKNDAETLAWMGQLPQKVLQPVEHRSEADQADLELVRARRVLIESRTQLINHVRGTLKSAGLRVKACDARYFARHAALVIPAGEEAKHTPILEMIDTASAKIKEYDRQIDAAIRERHPEALHLQRVPGVGPVTALTYILTVHHPERFRRSRQVGPYLGLTPARRQSGGRDPKLGISKEGDPYLRTLLVQCGHWILGHNAPDSDLRQWGLGLAAKRGKHVAVAAVARKLAVLLHHLHVTGEVYRPLAGEEEASMAA
jgi:transposase